MQTWQLFAQAAAAAAALAYIQPHLQLCSVKAANTARAPIVMTLIAGAESP